MRALRFVLGLTIAVACSGSETLSRSQAKAVLDKHYKTTGMRTMAINSEYLKRDGNYWFANSIDLGGPPARTTEEIDFLTKSGGMAGDAMFSESVVSTQADGLQRVKLEFTASGKYFATDEANYRVRVCETEKVEVTGISQSKQDNTAQVIYDLSCETSNAFGMFYSSHSPETHRTNSKAASNQKNVTVTMRKFDDGWRLEPTR